MLDEMPVQTVTATETEVTGTADATTPAEATPETTVLTQETKPERTYTKEQVIEMMKKRVARSHNAFFKRYGVENLEALDGLFENSKKFSSMNDEFGKIQLRNSELMRENAFLRNNIDPNRYDDIVAYFKGKDMDFSEDELLKALPTHNEWLKQTAAPATTTIRSLGSEAHTLPKVDEADIASRLLGVKL